MILLQTCGSAEVSFTINTVPLSSLQLSVCKVFREVTLGMNVDPSIRTKLLGDMAYMKERQYQRHSSQPTGAGVMTTT